MVLDYSAEKAYIFDHSWRQFKQKLIFPDLQKVDWDYYYAAYRKFLPHINNNWDFAEMLSEMLGEVTFPHRRQLPPDHPNVNATPRCACSTTAGTKAKADEADRSGEEPRGMARCLAAAGELTEVP